MCLFIHLGTNEPGGEESDILGISQRREHPHPQSQRSPPQEPPGPEPHTADISHNVGPRPPKTQIIPMAMTPETKQV